MSSPTVSVVVIFHDDERFLPEAVESVIAQTYKDWELVLADDGSTDGSSDIARDYVAANPDRVSYVHHDGHANRGISATRNLGVRYTRGIYVAFLDSDDVWNAEKLDEQVRILQRHPEVGLLFGASLYWWSWAEGATTPDRLTRIGAAEDVVHHPPSLVTTLYPLGDGTSPCPSSCIVRRDVLESLGGFEAHMPGLYDDQGFLGKVYLTTPVFVSSRCWDRYRRHPGAVTVATTRTDYLDARRYYLAWYEQHLDEHGIDDPAIRRALKRAWWPYRHPRLANLRRTPDRVRKRLLARKDR